MTLRDLHLANGATLAQDGIPLHYGDLAAEYKAALNTAVVLDRSHEGRLKLYGKDRFELLNRMSTNKMIDLAAGEGQPTIFTNANARIIDRIVAYNRDDHLLVITEPGQGATIAQFLQRHIFFNDDVRVENSTPATQQFALHGPQSSAIVATIWPELADIGPYTSALVHLGDHPIMALRRKPSSGDHWAFVMATDAAAPVYQGIMTAGQALGLVPAGGLTYNTLRIRAGVPARPELNSDYIPLEVGLWDEVNFAKGCYTGQEIIARMESRARLAKTIVALDMSAIVQAPADVHHEGRKIGRLTSSVQAPTGECFALAIIRTQHTVADTPVIVGEQGIAATVKARVGQQPAFIEQS